ncbi:MAG: 5'/3'-nucleotidase SurE [Deltaproteobacteria bacterium]|nr:5'/3'-nucleotidase SurE [Deltaproteobacteria bacterium]
MTRILLTNDDGIDAKGLLSLKLELEKIPDVELWIVAPDSQRSACSHGMTLSKPVSVQKLHSKTYSHSGLVADGVYLAIYHLMKSPPDIVVSGINSGANLAEDVIYSGTIAGARESVLQGISGIAISLIDGDDFGLAAKHAASYIVSLLKTSAQKPFLYNLNYPAGVFYEPVFAPLGTRPYEKNVKEVKGKNSDSTSYIIGGNPILGLKREQYSDVDLIEKGYATITPLIINQTDHLQIEKIRQTGEK